MSMFRVLHAELLKLKRTIAFRVIFVAPVLVALLQFLVLLKTKQFGSSFNLWETMPRSTFSVWAVFMLPLLITLETSLISGIEHAEKHWKHIFALPVRRHTVYLAKFLITQLLIVSSTLILCLLTIVAGLIGMRLRPELAGAGSPTYAWFVKYGTLVWLASWLIIAIHTWIAIRWSSFTVALSAGIGGTFFAIFAASAQLSKYYPWLLPLNVFSDDRLAAAMTLGIIGGVLVMSAACFELARRDVA
jgi:lantibiotic transport system permease protein